MNLFEIYLLFINFMGKQCIQISNGEGLSCSKWVVACVTVYILYIRVITFASLCYSACTQLSYCYWSYQQTQPQLPCGRT